MISFLKRLYHSYKLNKTKKNIFSSVVIGKEPSIYDTAYIQLLPSSKENIKIADYFIFKGTIVSQYNGQVEIDDHCLVGLGLLKQILIRNQD